MYLEESTGAPRGVVDVSFALSQLPVHTRQQLCRRLYNSRPELLNRLDEIVVFRQLSKESVRTIADLVLKETASRMVEKGIGLEVTKGMMAKIVEAGYDKRYGARPLRRAVMQLVDDKLSDEILNERIVEGDIARLTVDAEGEVAILKVTGPTHDDGAEIVYSHVIDLDSAGVSVDVESTNA